MGTKYEWQYSDDNPPKSLQEAYDSLESLKDEKRTIEVQLSDPEKKEDQNWRHSAIEAKAIREKQIAFLNKWIAQNRHAKPIPETLADCDLETPEGLLRASERVLTSLAIRRSLADDEIAVLNALRKWFKRNVQ